MSQVHLPSASSWCVFTDGSCHHVDRVGAWAWVAFHAEMDNDNHYSDSGIQMDTTINAMELTGPLMFLRRLHEEAGPQRVWILSDSQYTVLGASNRKRARNVNKRLWKQLDGAIDAHERVLFEHVKGHSHSHYNHLADKLARAARKEGLSAI